MKTSSKYLLSFFTLFLSFFGFAQDEDTTTVPTDWKYKAVGSFNGSQASFTNWNAGGQNSLSWTALIDAQANYNKNKIRWDNGINFAYGQNKILTNPWTKTNDIISIYTKAGYKIKNKIDLALLADFKSQFDLGYSGDFPNQTFASKFMAPGYLTLALGIDYNKGDDFKIMASPFASKMTFVKDFTLSQQGAFGVVPGEEFRGEFGAFFKILYNGEIMKNVNFKGRLELFSNYLDRPQNIDVNLETIFNFKINKWLTTVLSTNLIYDHDINITIYDSNNVIVGRGPRTQIKNVLSLGLSYTFAEKK